MLLYCGRWGGGSHPHPIRQNNRNGHKRKQSFNIYVITQSGKVSRITPFPLLCRINPPATTSWSHLPSRSSLAALAYAGWLKGSRPSPLGFFGEEKKLKGDNHLDLPSELAGSLTHLAWGCLLKAREGTMWSPQEKPNKATTTRAWAGGQLSSPGCSKASCVSAVPAELQ